MDEKSSTIISTVATWRECSAKTAIGSATERIGPKEKKWHTEVLASLESINCTINVE